MNSERYMKKEDIKREFKQIVCSKCGNVTDADCFGQACEECGEKAWDTSVASDESKQSPSDDEWPSVSWP